jgi:hypothetical protein
MKDAPLTSLSHQINTIIRDRKNALRSKMSDLCNDKLTKQDTSQAELILRAKLDELDTISEKIFKVLLSIYNDSKKQ